MLAFSIFSILGAFFLERMDQKTSSLKNCQNCWIDQTICKNRYEELN